MFKKSKLFCLVATLFMGIIPFVTAGTNVYASEKDDIEYTPSTEQVSQLATPQTIYKDDQGNIFTNDEIIVQTGNRDPRIQSRAPGAQLISVGILWTYSNKADGTKLRDMFRKAATVEGLAALTATVAAAGFATGPLDAVLAALVVAGGAAFHSRFSEGADEIKKHPNSGKIYMYLDHVTYSK
ncbi:MAG: hypothetical protein LBM95_04805 [Lactobacillales bacterium]|jgi:hypothetical protein|nr:hypothetical protein [Lactobacillales bacterium]